VAYALFGSSSGPSNAVPQVNGQTLKVAEQEITRAGLKFTVIQQTNPTTAKGIVISTSPPNGNSVSAGTTVKIFVSSGPKMVTMPRVKGKSATDAVNILKGDGLIVNQLTASNSSAPSGTVVKQDPRAGTKLKVGSQVTIFVSPGGDLVPNVIGQNLQIAIGNLGNAGLTNIKFVYVQNPGVTDQTVVSQSVNSGTRVPPRTRITLTVVQNHAQPSPTPTTASPTPTPTTGPTATPTP
jgi:serine/threonine-protein kinase